MTNTLADRDQLIGEVVNNLNVVLGFARRPKRSVRQRRDVRCRSWYTGSPNARPTSPTPWRTPNAAAGSIADLLAQPARPFSKVVHADRSGRRDRRRRPRLPRQPAQHTAGQVSGAGPAGHVRRLLQLLSVRRRAQAQRKGRTAGVRQGRRSGLGAVRTEMKSFTERNPLVDRRRRRRRSSLRSSSARCNTKSCRSSTGARRIPPTFADAGGLVHRSRRRSVRFPSGQGFRHRTRRSTGAGALHRRQKRSTWRARRRPRSRRRACWAPRCSM